LLTQQQQQQQQPLDALLQHWEVVCLLLGHLSRRESRSATAAALAALGALIDSSSSSSTAGSVSFVDVASMVVSLNSWAVTSLDEPDYNARLGCYSQLQPPAWQAFSRLQALPLTLQAYYDLRNDSDLALRQAAATALTKAVRAFAALDSPQQQQQQQDGEAADPAQPQQQQPQQQQQQQLEDLLRLVPRVMYPQTKVGLRSNNLSVRQEHAALLRELVLLLPQRFTDLVPLCNQDAEQDFFLNITHLQIHRRGRALALLVRLMSQQQPQQQPQQQQGSEQAAAAAAAEASDGAARKKRKVQDSSTQQQQDGKAGGSAAPAAAAEGDSDVAVAVGDKRPRQQQQHKPVSARVLLDIAAPLIQQFIFDGSSNTSSNSAAADAAAEAQRGGHGKKKGDADREGAVANVAIDALKGLAGQLGWEQYSGLLQRWLKLMTQYPRKQIIRAACAVLDAFHFPVEDPAAAEDHQQQQQQGSKQQQRGSKEAGTAAALAAAAATAAAAAAAAAGDAAEVEQVDLEVEEADDDVIIVEEEDEQAAAAAAMAATAAADAADIAASARVLLQSKVLPVLQSQVVVDDQEVARAPVALAIIKLIKVGLTATCLASSVWCDLCVSRSCSVHWQGLC
jgi:U3 small nucleolar RNA-associated protein 20